MVSILPPKGNAFNPIIQAMKQFGQNAPELMEKRYQQGQLRNSLDEISKIASDPNASNLDIMLSAMKAGAGIPGSERYMGAIIPEMLKRAEAERAKNIPQAGESSLTNQQPQARNREPLEAPQQGQPLPEFGGNRFFPTNKGPSEGPGHIPQEATTGKKLPLLAPNEKPAAARKLVEDNKKAGSFITMPQAMEQIEANQADIRKHNEQVDTELAQQVEAQKNYGQMAVNHLNKVYTKPVVGENGKTVNVPAATPEIEAVFKKFGEEIATQGKSEAEIDRALAIKAKNFSDSIANVKKDASAPRLINSIGRAIEGTYKNFEASSKDLRSTLEPILELGLYDTARNLLSGLDYYPEEIDITVNPLGEREKTVLNRVPKNTKIAPKNQKYGLAYELPQPSKNLENIKQGLRDLKEANPNFSLVLARKYFEDKDYDSRMFKDALNELEQEGFELEDDQKTQKGVLNTPPLSLLQKLLHSINVVGR